MFNMFKRKGIEEIIEDDTNYELVNYNYTKAFNLYNKKKDNSNFDKELEKNKLEKIIDDVSAEFNFISSNIAVIIYSFTIIITVVCSIISIIVTIGTGITGVHINEGFLIILLSGSILIYGVILPVIMIVNYENIKFKYKNDVFYSKICLKVIDDIENNKTCFIKEIETSEELSAIKMSNKKDIENRKYFKKYKKIYLQYFGDKIAGRPEFKNPKSYKKLILNIGKMFNDKSIYCNLEDEKILLGDCLNRQKEERQDIVIAYFVMFVSVSSSLLAVYLQMTLDIKMLRIVIICYVVIIIGSLIARGIQQARQTYTEAFYCLCLDILQKVIDNRNSGVGGNGESSGAEVEVAPTKENTVGKDK